MVVAIIALLAAMLMPSLAKARELAKASACLNNLHNIGLSMAMYTTEYHAYPRAYGYIDGESSSGGYQHWTAALSPSDYLPAITALKYPKTSAAFVCPSHSVGGWAPTNFTATRIPNPPPGQVSQDTTETIDDQQAPRLSYVANEIILPRKKYSSAHDKNSPPGASNLRYVTPDEIEGPNNTILIAEFSDNSNCIWGSSVGGGSAYKSHRPTNGVKSDQANGVFDGEGYPRGTKVYQLTYKEAKDAIDAVIADKNAAPNTHHISYINPTAHLSYSNYAFVDGHAGKATLEETFDPGNYMWGRKVYSCVDRPVIQDPVNP